jgi:polygalacturonase
MNRRTFVTALGLPLVATSAVPRVAAAVAGETNGSGNGDYNVRAFGALGDGKSNDTAAIQAAIDQCSRTGGRLVFPPGDYRTGMVRLRSRVTIELRNQAVWRAIPDPALYPRVVDNLPPAFLFAEGEQDLHLTGEGKIHGSGDAHEAFVAGPEQRRGPRPFGLLLRRCRNLSLTGITLESSAYWMLRPTECDDVVIRGVRIVNLANYNNDGIDVVDCHRVTISDCVLDCEDDGICLKTESPRGVEDVVITNCIVSSHARALKISLPAIPGSRFNRIAISNCIIKPTRAQTTLHPAKLLGGISGIDLATSSQGAAVTNVTVNNLVIDGVMTPIFLRLGNQRAGVRQAKPEEVASGRLEGVSLSNIRAVNAGPVACLVAGHPGASIADVRLSNITVSCRAAGTVRDIAAEVPEKAEATPSPRVFGVNLPAYGLYLRHVKDVAIDGLQLTPAPGEPRPELVADDVHGLRLAGLTAIRPDGGKPRIRMQGCTAVEIEEQAERL